MYTFFHYNTYRLLKDDVFYGLYGKDWTFIPAFFAGVVAITVSQPFEVIRSKISLSKCNEPIGNLVQQLARGGWRGFFVGYLPRLCRKPINSGICWTVLEWTRR